VLVLAGVCLTQSSPAQDSLGNFRTDLIAHFIDAPGSIWVGEGRYFMNDFSDTIAIRPDSSGTGLELRRTLVRTKDTVVMSRGRGQVLPAAAGQSYLVHWSEPKFANLIGTMDWVDGQWVISIDGEWSAWSVRLRYDTRFSFVAALAGALGNLPSVEVMEMTYRLVTPGP